MLQLAKAPSTHETPPNSLQLVIAWSREYAGGLLFSPWLVPVMQVGVRGWVAGAVALMHALGCLLRVVLVV
jgi:hypothetical protein